MKTKMLSFDTSSTRSGWAYFENGKLVNSGIINEEKEKDSVIRIENMCFGLSEILERNKPDIIVVEKPPYVNSPATLIMLAEIVGVIKGWALCAGYAEFVEYGPTEWRKLIANDGEVIPKNRKECKEWDIHKVLSNFNYVPADDNEADAILIGQARINQFKECNYG